MEEILLVVAQFFLEILFPLLAELFLNLIIYWLPSGDRIDRYFALVLLGGLLGAASGFIPSLIANHPIVQAAVVIVVPWVLAFLAERFFERREEAGKPRPELGYFWKVYWFAFPFLVARSIVIHHQSIRFW